MDVQSRKCGCGSVFRLATLMSRDTRCVACLGKEREALNKRRDVERRSTFVARLEKALEDDKPAFVIPECAAVPAAPKTVDEAMALMRDGWVLKFKFSGNKRRIRSGCEELMRPRVGSGWEACIHRGQMTLNYGDDAGDLSPCTVERP